MKVSRAAVFEPSAAERRKLTAGLEKALVKVSPAQEPAALGKEQLVVLGPNLKASAKIAAEVRRLSPDALILVASRKSSTVAHADGVLPLPISPRDLTVRLPELVRLAVAEKVLLVKPRPGEGVLDPDTQFYTFAHFKDLLFVEVKRARRYGFPVALAIISFDDKPGVKVGPELRSPLLGALAHAVRRSLRDTDYPVQQSADRVLVLMPHTDLAGAMAVCERIVGRVAALKIPQEGRVLCPTVSVGVAAVPVGGELSFGELARDAAASLAEARSLGGNRIAFRDALAAANLDGEDDDGPVGAKG